MAKGRCGNCGGDITTRRNGDGWYARCTVCGMSVHGFQTEREAVHELERRTA